MEDTEIDIMYEFPSATNIVFPPCQSNPSKATVDPSLTAAFAIERGPSSITGCFVGRHFLLSIPV